MWQTVQNPSKASECPQTTATGSAEASEAAVKPDVVGDMSISPRKKNPCHGRYPNHWKIPTLVLKDLRILSWSAQPLRMSNENLSCQGNCYARVFTGPTLT